MSMPYLRNNAKVGHGQGGEEITISKSFAKLAMNLTATLNTFLLEQYKKKQVLSTDEPAINADSPYSFTPVDDEDLPF